jgi:hypothetical protein
MILSDYISYFQAKAAKLGEIKKRFALYEPDPNFLPELSRFGLDLKDMCLLLGHYEMAHGGFSNLGNQRTNYTCNLLLIKAVKMNASELTLAVLEEAEQTAKHLYEAMLKDACANNFGYVFSNVKMDDRPWSIQKVAGLHDNACGVEVRFGLYENSVRNFPYLINPFTV